MSLLVFHSYGGFTFGLTKDSVPENFGKNGPTQFRKLSVRHLALVSLACNELRSFLLIFLPISILLLICFIIILYLRFHVNTYASVTEVSILNKDLID